MMKNPLPIRLLGRSSNESGDLFTRLVRDLFFSLGYDNLQLDVATSGREVDLQGNHRFENRRFAAECKAHANVIGGGDLNKFLGVLTRERTRHAPLSVAGYFVSLSGFTGSGIKQEEDSGNEGLILFDGSKVVDELQRARVIVQKESATEFAGRCVAANGLRGVQFEKAEVVCYSAGYLWAVYYSRGKNLSHFVFIHADGTPLAKSVAASVIDADKNSGGIMCSLSYVAPPEELDLSDLREDAFNQYKKWLGEECGYIQLDGLPADSDLSATKLRLERLFVPLRATYKKQAADRNKIGLFSVGLSGIFVDDVPVDEDEIDKYEEVDELDFIDDEVESGVVVEPIGDLLSRESHVAVLASPGGGKSTLVKRLATAYSFPDRRLEVADGLPERDWLPLYLRCRDLRDRSNRPVLELLHGISAFANMKDDMAKCFRDGVSDALRAGKVLLLVDGLDEISEEGSRRAFAQNLRTFVAMFPGVMLVVTSRVAGFRDIAGVIAGTCQQITLAPLDGEDVRRLCVSWHSEVVADTEHVRREASELADVIWGNRHIRSLVENPLLLTTLLVVKRSNGEIPPSRAELYSEAVRVLVRTWNVEGYAPLDERETLARLSYVACAMMQRGIQLIGNVALIGLLNDAAREMEPELQFAKVSPSEFIQRIEYRSSLLMQTGYQRLEGELQPVYEFRHLTFQEYLAAKGFVSEQYPGRNDEAPLVEVLSPHLEDERWQEVIPLASVLAGRKAEAVIRRILRECSSEEAGQEAEIRSRPKASVKLLGQCILEEVTLTPGALRAALVEISLKLGRGRPSLVLESIFNGKFGGALKATVQECYFSMGDNWTYFESALSEIFRFEIKRSRSELLDREFVGDLVGDLIAGNREVKVRCALLLMQTAFECRESEAKTAEVLTPFAQDILGGLLEMLHSGDLPSAQSASWSLAWLGHSGIWPAPTSLELIQRLFHIWRHESATELVRKAAWAFYSQPLFPRDSIADEFWGACDPWHERQWDESAQGARCVAAITLGWYRRSPWSDEKLVEMIVQSQAHGSLLPKNIRYMLSSLGEAGNRVVKSWDKKK
ncbi:NACHT domain-containing protein [Luteolibacter flavescens]|uniref:NACHT domain-containing protein n=1 Tax=Luteolibacter flavescens TaxID=1859460 RepID=A0ABT3FQ07_9BACT|nr:NACHT domain-containing protein [Luteolibacter flavescens]MCW1885661.1 NACHT domain-containing protein [Luteolibacter flavescens]